MDIDIQDYMREQNYCLLNTGGGCTAYTICADAMRVLITDGECNAPKSLTERCLVTVLDDDCIEELASYWCQDLPEALRCVVDIMKD